MQTAFTLTRRHGSQKWEVALGPETAMRDHREFLRKRRRAGEDPNYAEVALVQAQRVIRVSQSHKPEKVGVKPPEPAKPTVAKPKPAAKGLSMFGKRVANKTT